MTPRAIGLAVLSCALSACYQSTGFSTVTGALADGSFPYASPLATSVGAAGAQHDSAVDAGDFAVRLPGRSRYRIYFEEAGARPDDGALLVYPRRDGSVDLEIRTGPGRETFDLGFVEYFPSMPDAVFLLSAAGDEDDEDECDDEEEGEDDDDEVEQEGEYEDDDAGEWAGAVAIPEHVPPDEIGCAGGDEEDDDDDDGELDFD